MKTARIEIDGEMKDVNVFESVFEYTDFYGSDITHYLEDYHEHEDEYTIGSFNLLEDSDFIADIENPIYLNDPKKAYVSVNWGELDNSYIPLSALYQELYTIYKANDAKDGRTCTGMIFKTENEAQEKADELNAEVE